MEVLSDEIGNLEKDDAVLKNMEKDLTVCQHTSLSLTALLSF